MSRDAKSYRRSVELAIANRPNFLAGGPAPDLSSHEWIDDDLRDFDGRHVRVDTNLLSKLIMAAVAKDVVDESERDRWLAPRLHAALRLPRRLAGTIGFWAWLTINWGAPYVQRRWSNGPSESVSVWRYTGDLLRGSLSRLWWGAEMARNGADYSEVDRVFRRVRTAQFALELRYSWYRPAVIAFARVAEPDDRPALTDDEMKTLSKRINAYLSTICLESLASHETVDQLDVDWYRSPALEAELLGEHVPAGPDDNRVDAKEVDNLIEWFTALTRITNQAA